MWRCARQSPLLHARPSVCHPTLQAHPKDRFPRGCSSSISPIFIPAPLACCSQRTGPHGITWVEVSLKRVLHILKLPQISQPGPWGCAPPVGLQHQLPFGKANQLLKIKQHFAEEEEAAAGRVKARGEQGVMLQGLGNNYWLRESWC